MRLHLHPEKFSPPIPRFARPPDKLLKVYADPERRGFLASEEEIEKLKAANKEKLEQISKDILNLKIQ